MAASSEVERILSSPRDVCATLLQLGSAKHRVTIKLNLDVDKKLVPM
jgi:hypothetical protein